MPTRVDIAFKNVISINLPTLMDDLHVREADPDSARVILESVSSKEVDDSLGDKRVFALTGNGWSGTVIAGYVGVAEDLGAYDDPSSLLQ